MPASIFNFCGAHVFFAHSVTPWCTGGADQKVHVSRRFFHIIAGSSGICTQAPRVIIHAAEEIQWRNHPCIDFRLVQRTRLHCPFCDSLLYRWRRPERCTCPNVYFTSLLAAPRAHPSSLNRSTRCRHDSVEKSRAHLLVFNFRGRPDEPAQVRCESCRVVFQQ